MTHITFYSVVLALVIIAWIMLVGYEIGMRRVERTSRARKLGNRVLLAQQDDLVERLNDALIKWDFPHIPYQMPSVRLIYAHPKGWVGIRKSYLWPRDPKRYSYKV